MKTIELIEQVDKLGFHIEYNRTYEGYIIKTSVDNNTVAKVKANIKYSMDTGFHAFESMNAPKQDALADVIIKYASTPPRSREQRYIYMIEVFEDMEEANYKMVRMDGHIDTDSSSLDFCQNDPDYHFTASDVDALPAHLKKIFKACKIIPVEDN